jgi:ribonuclease HII
MYKEEQTLKQKGFNLIAGVDEAGRGPLAGPVVAAAVILPAGYKNSGIRDSKKLSAMERERLFVEIKNTALTYATGIVGPREIDEIGILEATKLAMRRAVMKLDPRPDFILIDAVPLNITGIAQKAIIKGDDKVFCVAAASIIAKVTRDRLMVGYHKKYPVYSFDRHMGYGTEIHLKAIKLHGPCPIHRKSFAPINGK